jgi:hypothetical protein
MARRWLSYWTNISTRMRVRVFVVWILAGVVVGLANALLIDHRTILHGLISGAFFTLLMLVVSPALSGKIGAE